MKSFTSLKNFFTKHGRNTWRIGHNPDIDWAIVFILGCIISIIYTGWAVTLYQSVASGDFFSKEDVAPQVKKVLDIKKLTSVNDHFQAVKAEPIPTVTVGEPI
ncbi:MAG: hypothetical protein HZA80_00975 [Candidatus Taylorbacteria bacterium]|nr:hypothetical protein [Candidatus Taylorbacteria bacterium]